LEENIKLDLKEMVFKDGVRIDLAQGRFERWVFINTAMNTQVP
jgi:hypothetical protein